MDKKMDFLIINTHFYKVIPKKFRTFALSFLKQ